MKPLPGRSADPFGPDHAAAEYLDPGHTDAGHTDAGHTDAGHTGAEYVDVGDFEQGSPFSRWALARYLVGRAVAESLGRSLLALGVLAVGLAVVATWVLHSQLLAALLVVFAAVMLLLNAAVRALIRRLTAVRAYAPLEQQLRHLVRDTRRDVLRELRRIGLPGRALTLPLLAVRLLGRRRRETMSRLRAFDVERAVPRSRLDELHMALRRAVGR